MNIEVKESRDKSGLVLPTSGGVMSILLASAANELSVEAQNDGIAGELSALLLADVLAAQATVKRLSAPVGTKAADSKVAQGVMEALTAKEVAFVDTLDQLPTAEQVAALEADHAGGAEAFEEPGEGDPAVTTSNADEQEANAEAAGRIVDAIRGVKRGK